MIRTLVQIIPALVVGILIGIFLSTQDYSNLREITLGELLNVLTNLFFIGIVTYYIIQVSNTNLKRREMLLGYFDELRENFLERWTDYWDIATASPFMSISLDSIPPEQIDRISSSHDALQSRLRSWQMGLYFNTPS